MGATADAIPYFEKYVDRQGNYLFTCLPYLHVPRGPVNKAFMFFLLQ